jgi:HEAT repeat protein
LRPRLAEKRQPHACRLGCRVSGNERSQPAYRPVDDRPGRQIGLHDQIVSLCRIEAPEALDLLIRTLLDPRAADWLRWDCAAALGAIGKPDALDALEWTARTDPDELLRECAKEALEVIQSPEAA